MRVLRDSLWHRGALGKHLERHILASESVLLGTYVLGVLMMDMMVHWKSGEAACNVLGSGMVKDSSECLYGDDRITNQLQ